MARELYIHAGAHRTGTSSFQQMLGENWTALVKAGVVPLYPARDGAPGGQLRLRLPGPKAGPEVQNTQAARVEAEIARHIAATPPHARILLSEENIPGAMRPFFSGRFYPVAAMRCALLSKAMAAQGITRPKRMVFVVRPYAELFVSAYRKRAEDNPMRPFADLIPAFMSMHRGWAGLIAALKDLLDPEEFVVLSYPRRGRSVDLLEQVLGTPIPGLQEPVARINTSASDAALEVLQKRYHAGEKLSRRVWQSIVAEYAEQREPRGVAAFASREKAMLDARYAAHCGEISEMPGVTFVA